MLKKLFVGVGALMVLTITYLLFDKFTASNIFVASDREMLNQIASLSPEKFRESCDALSSFSHVDGLSDGAMGTVGGKTYYYKSYCYQQLAVATLDENPCAKVRKRWAILDNGSGVSEEECRVEVAGAKKAAAERANESAKNASVVSGRAKIISTKVTPVTESRWKIEVEVQGDLMGDYRFEVKSVNQDKVLATETTTLKEKAKSFSWMIDRTSLVDTTTQLPAIFPIAVSFTYLIPKGTEYPTDESLPSIGNATISINQ